MFTFMMITMTATTSFKLQAICEQLILLLLITMTIMISRNDPGAKLVDSYFAPIRVIISELGDAPPLFKLGACENGLSEPHLGGGGKRLCPRRSLPLGKWLADGRRVNPSDSEQNNNK